MSIVDQGFLWTYGLWLTRPNTEKVKFKFKYFFNPALCAVSLALALILLNMSMPPFTIAPLLSVGQATTPLSLIYLGGLSYYSDWKAVIKCTEFYWGVITKMMIFPIIYYYSASLFYSDQEMVKALSIISALPTMVTIAMFAKENNNEAEYTLGLVLATTFISLLTLTLISYLLF